MQFSVHELMENVSSSTAREPHSHANAHQPIELRYVTISPRSLVHRPMPQQTIHEVYQA